MPIRKLVSSAPGVQRRFLAVQEILSKDRIFPADRIVQGVGTGVAPMTIKPVLSKGRARARQFEELVGCGNRDLGGEDLCLRRNDLRFGDGFGVGIENSPVDGVAGLFQKRLCRMQPDASDRRSPGSYRDRPRPVPARNPSRRGSWSRTKRIGFVDRRASRPIPASTAAWMIWNTAPSAVGAS
jgi:hypothetical protein